MDKKSLRLRIKKRALKKDKKYQNWVILVAHFFLYWILVFGASTVIVPYLIKIFLFYGQDAEGFVFNFIIYVFIIGSGMRIFIKIVDMVDVKNKLLSFSSIILMSTIITVSINPITKVTIDDYNQVKKQEYKLNKLFCDRYPTECLNNK
ncbi:hypothetical protein DES39_1893 [Orbus hercynius]|uniref:Uncharacterized protein n=1 Tax=Orbus hercynius TaxID=593135 RepID=A0A495RBG6_9GAMM|nr:hypothetical protein [Orbus hercynius]RKS84681.1 hypothetical protein DES39_1893 [Orbus hercynius]